MIIHGDISCIAWPASICSPSIIYHAMDGLARCCESSHVWQGLQRPWSGRRHRDLKFRARRLDRYCFICYSRTRRIQFRYVVLAIKAFPTLATWQCRTALHFNATKSWSKLCESQPSPRESCAETTRPPGNAFLSPAFQTEHGRMNVRGKCHQHLRR